MSTTTTTQTPGEPRGGTPASNSPNGNSGGQEDTFTPAPATTTGSSVVGNGAATPTGIASSSGTADSQPAQTSAAGSGNSGSSSKGGVGTGAIAGAAVGCFIAGLLVAGLIALFMFKKRANRRNSFRGAGAMATTSREPGVFEKNATAVTVAPVGVFDFLPQQADDAEVRQRLSTLTDQIQLHVENFYQDQKVQMTPALEGELSRFETSQLATPLPAGFESTSRPTVMIKHCLAYHIFNLTMSPGKATQPLLPAELSGMVGAVYNKVSSPQASKNDVQAFSEWKRLTAYLRPDLFNSTSSALQSDQTDQAFRMASHCTSVFAPWANQEFPEARRSTHLAELIEQAVKTALWLFSQPDSYRFDWSTTVDVRDKSRSQGSPIVVAPAVLKVSHAGALLARPQGMLNAVVKRS